MANYYCFRKDILRNRDLTFEAKAILSYLFSVWYCTKEVEIETNFRLFENIFGISSSFVTDAFRELRLKGFIKLTKSKIGSNGEQFYYAQLQNEILKKFPDIKEEYGIKKFIVEDEIREQRGAYKMKK